MSNPQQKSVIPKQLMVMTHMYFLAVQSANEDVEEGEKKDCQMGGGNIDKKLETWLRGRGGAWSSTKEIPPRGKKEEGILNRNF